MTGKILGLPLTIKLNVRFDALSTQVSFKDHVGIGHKGCATLSPPAGAALYACPHNPSKSESHG
jgi:hypothetical protein